MPARLRKAPLLLVQQWRSLPTLVPAIGLLGSRENITRAKAEIVSGMCAFGSSEAQPGQASAGDSGFIADGLLALLTLLQDGGRNRG